MKEQEERITEKEVLEELVVPLQDFYDFAVSAGNGAIQLNFPNGQMFELTVKEKI